MLRAKGMSENQLALAMGVTQQRVNQMLRQSNISTRVLRRLARITGATEAYLRGDPDADFRIQPTFVDPVCEICGIGREGRLYNLNTRSGRMALVCRAHIEDGYQLPD